MSTVKCPPQVESTLPDEEVDIVEYLRDHIARAEEYLERRRLVDISTDKAIHRKRKKGTSIDQRGPFR